jgi:hypothetical protein
MTYTVEIMLRETHAVESVTLVHRGTTAAWTVQDAADVLRAILDAIDRLQHPARTGGARVVLRGVSWIVSEYDGRTVIGVDIPSGQAVAGPFDVDTATLDGLIRSAVELESRASGQVH